MKLSKLNLVNFKGVKEFSLDVAGENAIIYGDNATGKTTICDAINWLLFDKDSQQRKQFEIKTLDKYGQAIHGLSHGVEGVFILDDGREVNLKKIHSETWTKKRGEAQKQFTGHSTDYFIDDVPVKKNEFSKRTSEMFDEDLFKLLTSPTYFSDVLKWKDRRDLLLKICGDVTDADVVTQNKDLSGFLEMLGAYTVDDYKKMVVSKRSKINDELEKIPVRIDEVERGLPDVSKIDVESNSKKITALKQSINEKESEINRIREGGQTAELNRQLAELESEIYAAKHKAAEERDKIVSDQVKIVKDLDDKHFQAKSAAATLNRETLLLATDIKNTEKRLQELRSRWLSVNSEKFMEPDQPGTCPACGQSIPDSMINEARQKALSEFNLKKSKSLEKIDAEGLALKKQLEEFQSKHKAALEKELIAAQEAEKALKELKAAELKIEEINSQKFFDSSEFNERRNKILSEIQKVKAEPMAQASKIAEEIAKIREEIKKYEDKNRMVESRVNGEKRIEELKENEKVLAAEFERIEKELFLIEKFIKTKVELLESTINSKFKMARFKLFKEQINGGLDECCDVTFNGVPYSDLNNGARINVGLDIIATLQSHYETSAPVFIDNAESVTNIIDIGCQVIKLVVSENDKTLRIIQE